MRNLSGQIDAKIFSTALENGQDILPELTKYLTSEKAHDFSRADESLLLSAERMFGIIYICNYQKQ